MGQAKDSHALVFMLGNGSSIILFAQKAFPVIGVEEATAMEILKMA